MVICISEFVISEMEFISLISMSDSDGDEDERWNERKRWVKVLYCIIIY